jgi:hypothetical protein
MRKQIGTPEILKKSHAHQSAKDYSRKNKSNWFDDHVEVIGFDDSSTIKSKLKEKFLKGGEKS